MKSGRGAGEVDQRAFRSLIGQGKKPAPCSIVMSYSTSLFQPRDLHLNARDARAAMSALWAIFLFGFIGV
jgi:hypothetical protein